MTPEAVQERWGRVLVVLAALLFAGMPVWLGLGLRRRPGPPAVGPGAMRAAPPVALRHGLRLLSGPSLERGSADRLYLTWRTSLPADSFVTFGRADAVEQIAVKDTALLTDHRFVLPDEPFIGFCRLHVMSVAEGGESISAEIGPGVGQGGAAFEAAEPETFAALSPTDAYAWADWDGDGDLEAAVSEQGEETDRFAVLGRLTTEWEAVGAGEDAFPSAEWAGLHWADMDADGRPDLVRTGPGVTIRRNRESGLAADAVEWRAGELALRAASVCDMDADGIPDVVGLGAGAAVHILRAEPANLQDFSEQIVELPAGEGAGVAPVIVTTDFTGDHRPDILTGTGRLILLAGSEDGYEEVDGALPPALARPGADSWLEPADWDGDGNVDLLLSCGEKRGRVALLRNDGWGRFHETAEVGELPRQDLPATCGAWADLDGNGLPDLVLGTADSGVLIYLNAGDEGFMDATALCRLPLRGGLAVRSLSLPDVDGDAAPDLVVGTEARAFVLLNRWRPSSHEAFLKIVPRGTRGLSGCVAAILDVEGSVRASARIPGRGSGRATGPAEFCFGVVGLERCTGRVSFSHRERIVSRWERSAGSSRLVVTAGTGVLPPP